MDGGRGSRKDGTTDMPWRKWLVRGLVYSVLCGSVLAFLLYHFWTSPAIVRRQVLAKLTERIPGATITLDSAYMRLFGGIAVGELRMSRRDDLDKADFLYVPSAVIYPDKEQMLDGTLALRKIDIFRPLLRIVRERDGRLNLVGLVTPPDLSEQLATFVIQQGTIVFEDRGIAPGGGPLLEIKDVNLTVVNDPLPTLNIDGTGCTDLLGPVRLSGRVRRDSGAFNLEMALPSIPVGPALVQRFAVICPNAAAYLPQFRADGEVRATIGYQPENTPAFTFDVHVKLHNGQLSHAKMPLSLEDLEAELHLVNAPGAASALIASSADLLRVPSAHLTARSGKMRLDLSLQDLSIPCSTPTADEEDLYLDRLTSKLAWTVEHFPVTKELFDRFPSLKEFQHDYKPVGQATVRHTFSRDERGGWKKTWHIEPEGMSAEYVNFQDRIDNVRGFENGSLDIEKSSDRKQHCEIRLTGTTEGRPITITGSMHSEGDAPGEVNLTIRGKDIPLDDKLERALEGPSRLAYHQFHPEGLADFDVLINRPRGTTRFANRFLVTIHDAAFTYDLFPYRLENVSGILDVLPDHWEARDFRATHHGGMLRFGGRSFPSSTDGQHDPAMRVEIHGTSLSLDDREFEAALAPAGLPARAAMKLAYQEMAFSGRMNFDADVIDLGGNDPPNLDVTVSAHGCSLKPQFFKYQLDDAGAIVHYTRERVTFREVDARHGAVRLHIDSGQVLAKTGGGFQTRIGNPDDPRTGLLVTGLTADADLLGALPPTLRNGLESVKLRGPMDVKARLVVDPQTDGKDAIWWNGTVAVRDAALQAGVDLTGVQGEASCCGMYRDQSLRSAVGSADIKEASVLGQPFHHLHTTFVVREDSPQLLRFYNVGADLFGGQIGGEAHIDFTGEPRFELDLVGVKVRLEQFGRYNEFGSGTELEGMAKLSLFLKGKTDDVSSLRGAGMLDVPNGKLYRLPPLLDLLKALGLRAPDRTAFERARLEFNVEGERVKVNALNLIGSAVSLRGQGTVKIDGSDLNLDFNADPGMLQVPVISDIQHVVSDQLLKIKVRGSLTQPRFEKELIPGVVDPVRRLLGTTN